MRSLRQMNCGAPRWRFFAALLLCCGAGRAGAAESIFREDFEGPEPSWQLLAADARYHVDEHQRVRDPVHSGDWSEALTLTALDGTYIHFGREVGAARVIDELSVSLYVLADHPGLQLLVRVVLPRSIDPQTGQPQTLLLYGPMVQRVGEWQQLTLDHLPQEVQRQARVVQASLPRAIDVREAYVDAVMLNVYGGNGTSHVWIDDLAISGFVGRQPRPSTIGSGVRPASFDEPASRRALPGVSLHGSVLSVGGKPFLPRLIEYRGESLLSLRQLGFNGVKLSSPPEGALLAEAAENRMWIVCPPPPLQGGATIGPEFDPVLAWDLGEGLSQRELAAAQAAVRQLRTADREVHRPILCDAVTELRAYSELVNVMVMGRATLGTSLEMSDFATWQQQRSALLRSGTPFWLRIETQPSDAWVQQVAALTPGPPPATELGSRQERHLVFVALAGGARGLVFESRSSLQVNDSATRHRANLLKLINLELTLIEPWAAAGSFVTPATASDPAMSAVVLQTDRARLLMALRFARGDQFVVDEGAGGEVTFVVPGVPESNDAFELSPAGLRPLPHRRVTGGMSVVLRDAPPAALIAMTQDPLVIDSLSRIAAVERRSAAELSRQLAVDELDSVEAVDRQLAGPWQTAAAPQWLGSARQQIQLCDAALSRGDDSQAIQFSREALRPLEQLRRVLWQRVTQPLGSPMLVPFAESFATLPQCAGFVGSLRSGTLGGNLLPAGDFENLDQLRQSGWQHFQLPQPHVRAVVELSAQGPHAGLSSLRLGVATQPGEMPPTFIESSPLWVTSPPVAVEARQVVQIHGWVRVPRPITGSVDGLLIVDSLGGEALAERVGQTRGWQEFTLYRAAPASGSLTVTFAMSGLGEAFLDDVTIHCVTLPPWNVMQQAERWAPGTVAGLPAAR